MNDLLFAVPWWIPVLLGLIGAGLLWDGNRRQISGQLKIGAAILALAVAWALLSYFVDTDKEKVERLTRNLVQDAVDARWEKFKSALAPSVEFSIRDFPRGRSADEVTAVARAGCESVRLRSAHIQNLRLEQTGPFITVHCDIFSTEESLAPTEVSTWQFEWEQSTGGWKLRELRLMQLKDVGIDQLQQAAPKLR